MPRLSVEWHLALHTFSITKISVSTQLHYADFKHEPDCQSRANEWDMMGQNSLIIEINRILENLVQTLFLNVILEWVISVINSQEQYFLFILSHFLVISWSFLGHFLVISWTFLGHFLVISWSNIIHHYVECHCLECHDAECHYTECHYAECHNAKCHNAVCYSAECHNAECHNAECDH